MRQRCVVDQGESCKRCVNGRLGLLVIATAVDVEERSGFATDLKASEDLRFTRTEVWAWKTFYDPDPAGDGVPVKVEGSLMPCGSAVPGAIQVQVRTERMLRGRHSIGSISFTQ